MHLYDTTILPGHFAFEIQQNVLNKCQNPSILEAMAILLKLTSYKNHLTNSVIKCCLEELTDLSSIPAHSLLRKTDSESLKHLEVDAVFKEFERRIPTISKVVKKLTKDDKYCTTQICNSIVSAHNEHLSALRYKNGLFFRQCGLLRKVRIIVLFLL